MKSKESRAKCEAKCEAKCGVQGVWSEGARSEVRCKAKQSEANEKKQRKNQKNKKSEMVNFRGSPFLLLRKNTLPDELWGPMFFLKT